MKPKPLSKQEFASSEGLADWFDSDLGRLLVSEEQATLGQITRHLFGYQLLELGYPVNNLSYLSACPVKNKIRIAPGGIADPLSLVAQFERLPVASDSIDAVILPHTLDFSIGPKEVLREVERVLIPEGRLIVCGFNPISLWGASRMMPGRRKRLPWGGHFISYPRLQDWISLLGFDVVQVHCKMFRPPIPRVSLMTRLKLMETYGARLFPWLAGVYVVEAIKRVSTVTPIKPKWHIENKLANGALEPTSRSTREING